jgi:hypothetical protein
LTTVAGERDLHAMAIAHRAALFTRWAETYSTRLPALMDDQPEDLLTLAVNAEIGPSLNRHMRERFNHSLDDDDHGQPA